MPPQASSVRACPANRFVTAVGVLEHTVSPSATVSKAHIFLLIECVDRLSVPKYGMGPNVNFLRCSLSIATDGHKGPTLSENLRKSLKHCIIHSGLGLN